MTELVPTRKDSADHQITLAEIQDQLDARNQQVETRSSAPSRKSRVAGAKRAFDFDPEKTLDEIKLRANLLAEVFDRGITEAAIPLSQRQINRLSYEFYQLDKLKIELEALETRYRALVYAHLDNTVERIPGRPASQTPGKVAAEGPGPHHVFERRGGGRSSPTLDLDSLREALPQNIVAELYKTVHYEAVPARDEERFDQSRSLELVDAGVIDLDVVAEHLIPGEWRTPSFYKTLVDGE